MQTIETNKHYSISDLCYLTGYERRTIHYYSKKRVIPPPEGFGTGSFYKEVHLYRLLLVRYMKKSHLKLPGIREAFEGMTLDEMRRLLKKVQFENPEWKLPALENWMVDAPRKMDENLSMFESSERISESDDQAQYESNYMETVKRKKPEATSWDKITLEDGVEVHIRADKSRQKENILKAVRNLMEDPHD